MPKPHDEFGALAMEFRTGSDILADTTQHDLVDKVQSSDADACRLLIASARYFSYRVNMSKVEQIKAQIDALTWQERCELNALLQNWPDDDWDRQMASEGKFDRLMEEAAREYREGQCRKWPRA